MKKINVISWFITMMMTLVASQAFAASGTNYEVEVGNTLRLDISDWGVECMANGSSYTWEISQAYVGDGTNYNEYLTFTSKSKNYAIVKGLKAGVLVGIQYTGYYYYNGTRKEFYDVFYVRVVNSGIPSTGPATLEVFPTPQTMKVGETKWVYAKQTRAVGGTYFYSEDESVATVTRGELASEGSYTTAAQITAKKAGKVNIVAKNVNGLAALCEVTVTPQPNTSQTTEYEVSCHIYNNGKMTYNGSELTGYDSFKVTEGSDVTMTIVPDEGYKIDWLWIDYEDVKDQLDGNVLTIRNVKKNIYVLVSFEKEEQVPDEPNEPVVTIENTLSLGDVSAYIGSTVAFPISLTNKDEITALQMDLHLPIGITLATDEEGDVKIETSSRVSNSHTIDCNKMADGSYRIICYSTKNATFTGTSGELFNVVLNIGADLADDDYEIMATNIELSDNTGIAHTGQDIKGKVTVKSYVLGDTDNNGKHTINDAVCIINHILNQPNGVFIEAAADLDGNGKITINDAVQLISKYILGTASNARKAMCTAEVGNEANIMSMEDVVMQPGEVKTIEVMMTNERDDIKGMQCDITLPQGISFIYDQDVEDYISASSRIPQKMTLASEMQNENTLRVAGVCTGSSCIYGNSGSVFAFKVKADENIEAGIYEIQLSNVELSYGEAVSVANHTSTVKITSSTSRIAASTIVNNEPIVIYDLKGQRVDSSKAMNGIYIMNGKKMYIK